MKEPDTAAADPIFYAHHANVDRWWMAWDVAYGEYWKKEKDYCDWLEQDLFFIDHFSKNKSRPWVRLKAKDLLDTKRLGYSYKLPEVKARKFQAVPVTADGLQGNLLIDIEKAILEVFQLVSIIQAKNAAIAPPSQLLTVHFTALPSKDLASGYYLTGLQTSDKLSDPVTLGGFGVFGSSEHHQGHPASVQGNFCISPETLHGILKKASQNQGKLAVVCKRIEGPLPDPLELKMPPFIDLELKDFEFRVISES